MPSACPPTPSGFRLLIAAQFISALADNALLIVAIAMRQQQGHPARWAPLPKFNFSIACVVLLLGFVRAPRRRCVMPTVRCRWLTWGCGWRWTCCDGEAPCVVHPLS